MKINIKAFAVLIPTFVFALGSCGASSSDTGPKPVPYVEEPNVKETSVYMGLFDSKEYTPDSKLDFEVRIADTSIVIYDGAYLRTNINEGTTVASFISSTTTYNVTVTVSKDSTVPLFELESQEVSVYKGATYSLDTFLSYRGIDVGEYEHTINITRESDERNSSIVVDDESLLISGNEIGSDTYTIYTEFVGFTLSKTLTVSVKGNDGLVLCGKNLTYDNLGPHYTISMYRYSDSPIDLKDDIRVLKGGIQVPYENLTITFDNPSILSLDGTVLKPSKGGKTSFVVATGGDSITVNAEVYKPILNDYDFELAEKRFDLDMSVVADDTSRTLTPSSVNEKTFVIPTDKSYQEIRSVAVNGKEIVIDTSKASYDASGKEVTLSAQLFDVSNYGKQSVTITLDAADYADTYTCIVDFVTKYISTYSEMKEYLVQNFEKDVIFGQYVLKNDIDGEGKDAMGKYISMSPINYAYGFRGILDGEGHSIGNYKSSMMGLFYIIGNGAVIKNLTLDDVTYNVKESATDNRGQMVLGRFISGATFDDITINLDSDNSVTTDSRATGSQTDSTGIVCTETFNYCVVRNMEIHAEGLDIVSVFGKQIPGTTFYNVNVYCNSLKYVGSARSEVEGVTFHKA